MLIECLDQTSLRKVPLFKGQVSTDAAKIVGLMPKLDSIDGILVSSECVN